MPFPNAGPRVLEGATHSIYAFPILADDAVAALHRQRNTLIANFGSLPTAIRAIACLLDCAHLIGQKPAPAGVIVNLLVAAQGLEAE